MKAQSLNPYQFLNAFRTQRQCMEYMFRLKYPEGYQCPKCEHRSHFTTQHRGGSWICKKCRYTESAKAGTIFHNSKIELKKWFHAIYEMTVTKGGVSALELQFKLGLGSYHSAFRMLHKLRHAMGLRDKNYEIGGIIEIDGALFGRKITGTYAKVYIAIESRGERAGFAKALVVDKTDKANAEAFIDAFVKEGATIRSDKAGGLNFIRPKKDIQLDSERMWDWEWGGVSGIRKDAADKHLRWINTLIGNIKTAFRGTFYGVSPEYLQLYLDEYIYRFNRRWWRKELQSRLLQACIKAGPWQFNAPA